MTEAKELILNALDDLTSSRSSLSRRSRALNSLERHLAEVCTATDKKRLDEFVALQNGFEGNVASRILASLGMYLPALQQLLSSDQSSDSKVAQDAVSLAHHTQQSLSILQGVALIHPPTKFFLGRKSALHLLLDILSISREASPINLSASSSSSTPNGTYNKSPLSNSTSVVPPSLASAVLDTLLCILVDSPEALRVFEDANGVETVVKTLKRAGVARDVRMKCLEFLYFYLLPEDGNPSAMARCASTPSAGPSNNPAVSADVNSSKSVPASPVQGGFPKTKPVFVSGDKPRTPAPLSKLPPLDTKSRPQSPSKVSSGATTPTSPAKPSRRTHKYSLSSSALSDSSNVSTPISASALTSAQPSSPRKKSLALQMLNREVDYVPMTPKKAQVARLGVGTPGKPKTVVRSSGTTSEPKVSYPSMVQSTPAKKAPSSSGSKSGVYMAGQVIDENEMASGSKSQAGTEGNAVFEESTNRPNRRHAGLGVPSSSKAGSHPMPRIRSTEEKKELLGAWLGNVDALVDGVEKAGVWGLAR